MPHPDRIDFTQLTDDRVIVTKLRRDAAGRRDVPVSSDIHINFNLIAALDWCRAHGYTVRTWHGGARAWRGKAWVIRTRAQIRRKRRRVEAEVERWIIAHPSRPTAGLTLCDFAYDM